MTHWGWYWRVKKKHTPKPVCEQYTCVDAFEIFKEKGPASFTFRYKDNVIQADLKDDYFEITGESFSYNLPYEKQACHFGGFRYYFRCPLRNCNRRMRKLYCEQAMFVCRNCLKLGYHSQRVFPSRRFAMMEEKIEKRLTELGGSSYQKPMWMRWKTFRKLSGKMCGYDIKSLLAGEEEIFKMFGVY